jgi:ATP dependent DNA ligase-like protein
MLIPYEFCLATAGKQVPSGPDWIHEVKHDGYRMLVIRENERVRLFSRNGYDWTGRYPWIVEAAGMIRQNRFVLAGEAVILGVDGIADFNALHSRQHDHEVQLCAFDILVEGGDDLRKLPLHLRNKPPAAFSASSRGYIRQPLRARRDRPRAIPGGLPDGLGRLGLEASGPPVSGWSIEALGEAQEPRPSRDVPGHGCLVSRALFAAPHTRAVNALRLQELSSLNDSLTFARYASTFPFASSCISTLTISAMRTSRRDLEACSTVAGKRTDFGKCVEVSQC